MVKDELSRIHIIMIILIITTDRFGEEGEEVNIVVEEIFATCF